MARDLIVLATGHSLLGWTMASAPTLPASDWAEVQPPAETDQASFPCLKNASTTPMGETDFDRPLWSF